MVVLSTILASDNSRRSWPWRWRYSSHALVFFIAILPGFCTAFESDYWSFGGHIKGQFLYGTYPEDSLFREITGANSSDINSDIRLLGGFHRAGWEVVADYQFVARYGDTVELSRAFAGLETVPGSIPTDELRWFDLTDVISNDGKHVVLQRLDRLYVGYTGERWVARFGRQVQSWGNGLVYQAMDFFNPFDPAAIDKEYKTGDDMLYSQYLRSNGDDLQLVGVVRRAAQSGDVEADVSTLALKYHGLLGAYEYDALVAHHYGDNIVGIGGNRGVGGAIWRGDFTLTRTDIDTVPLVVTSLSYSWVMGNKNVSGMVEYFYNGFGITDGDYDPESLFDHPDLLERIGRGELYTLGRNYLVANMLIEMTPLFILTPGLFTNLTDPSALLQITGQYDLMQDLQLIAALNVPLGANGTEFGGIDSGADGIYLSSGPSLFTQIAWYF
jgi:hypothetical protein